MQGDRGLRVVNLMAATKSPDSNPLKAGSLDQTHDGVLLLQGRDPILVSGAKVNRGIKKVCAGLQSRISITEVVFIRTGDVNSDDVTTVSGKKRRHITDGFASPENPAHAIGHFSDPGKLR